VDLSQLVSLEEIRSLQSRYCLHLDRKQWDELASVFAPDARLELNDRDDSPTTPERIVGFIAAALPTIQTSHHATCSNVELIDDDHAHGLWEAMYAAEGGPISFGFYDNDFRRVDGVWKIAVMRRIKAFEHAP
jgi:hypothetical protein